MTEPSKETPATDPDRWGYVANDYAEVFVTLADEFVRQASKRASDSYVNVLLGPHSRAVKDPASLNLVIEQVSIGVIVWAVLGGYVTLNETAVGTSDPDGAPLSEDELAKLTDIAAVLEGRADDDHEIRGQRTFFDGSEA